MHRYMANDHSVERRKSTLMGSSSLTARLTFVSIYLQVITMQRRLRVTNGFEQSIAVVTSLFFSAIFVRLLRLLYTR